MKLVRALRSGVLCLLAMGAVPALCADWPTWRCDQQRSASSPEALPAELALQWTRSLPAQTLAWPHEPRLQFDTSYEPVIMGGTLYVGCSVDGSVRAYETESGAERWRFYAEGPVRFAPVAWQGRVYFGSDDGYLYCVDAETGALNWRVRGAPEDRPERRHLGNARLISFWPVRGGPVVSDGVVYFGAGIWPTQGVFITAVDAESGETLWVNADGGRLADVRIDHNELHEAALSPQGYLLTVGKMLVVPNGRSMPARLNRTTGKLLYFVQGYRNGDCRVTASGKYAFVGETGVVDLTDGREVGSRWAEAGDKAPVRFDSAKFDLFEGPYHPYKFIPACDAHSVLDGGVAYGMQDGVVYAYDVARAERTTYEKESSGNTLNPARWEAPLAWKLETQQAGKKTPTVALIKAGDRLYGHAGNVLLAIDLPGPDGQPEVAWEKTVEGTPTGIIAGDGKLFVATKEGRLYCYAEGATAPTIHPLPEAEVGAADGEWPDQAAAILKDTGASGGYCVVLGLRDGGLVEELLRQSELHVIAVDADPSLVTRLRGKLTDAGVYGSRCEVLVGDPAQFDLPSYLASLIVSEEPAEIGLDAGPGGDRLFELLRPYGGVACLPLTTRATDTLASLRGTSPQAETATTERFALLRRAGALPGSADWTHESSDAARSYASKDTLVKAPLGVLWYGDGDGYGFFKFKDYGTGVKPQVAGGRLIAFQVYSRTLHAMDIYTGLQLWQVKVQPFTRYVSMPDAIYVATGTSCVVYDPASGKPLQTFDYDPGDDENPSVIDIRVADDVILIAVAFDRVRMIEKGMWDSSVLVALDRRSGKQLWTLRAQDRFNCHSIAMGNGSVFCVDSMSGAINDKLKRRGEAPEEVPSTLIALDARTGQERWRTSTQNRFRTYTVGAWLSMRTYDDWLAYCAELDLLIGGKHDQVRALNAATGAELWHKTIGGGQPIVIEGTRFMNQGGHVYDARTGEQLSKTSAFTRGGCNYAVANEALVFVRDRSVCYVDRETGEKHYLRNIRSGCSNSLVAAGGLLNAPCFSVQCVCNYPIQTSFAMMHMPEVAAWDQRPVTLAPDAN